MKSPPRPATGSDIEATTYAIADNRPHQFASWDEPSLVKILEELRAEDALNSGYSDEDIDRLNDELPP